MIAFHIVVIYIRHILEGPQDRQLKNIGDIGAIGRMA